MNNMVSIKEKRLEHIDLTVHDFLNPDYVYIPIQEGYELAIKTGAEVYKEQVLLKNSTDSIYSPVSGKVLGKTSSMKENNNKLECIVVENDFREKVNKKKGTVKYISDYSKEEMLKLIDKYNACKKSINLRGKTLIINGIDADPFEKTSSLIINTYSDKILEAIDALANILEVETTIFAINNNDSENVINLSNNIGTYPNITLKLMPDIYPIGWKDILIKNILTRKQENNGYTYLTVQDVYNIYNVLKRRKPITEKLVTVGGNAIEHTVVLNVKIGSSMNDLIKNCCNIIDNNYYVVINGLIAGKTLTSLNNIITEETVSIFLNTVDKEVQKKCINCGLCNSKCPVGLNPKYIKEHKNADKRKCIGCGLCTYICPSKINFKECLGGKEHE